MKDRLRLSMVVAGMLLLTACSGGDRSRQTATVAPTARKTVLWLSPHGVGADTEEGLAAVGVDQLVVRRGTIRLSGAAPVVQLLPAPMVEGQIPTAVALEVRGILSEEHDRAAVAVWAALEADFGADLPTELILDLPEIGEGASGFVSELAQHSGLAVVPVLTVPQLETEAGQAVAKAAHRCIVPVFGSSRPATRAT